MFDEKSAAENEFYVVNEIKKTRPDTMIVIIADEDVNLRGKNIDEYILTGPQPRKIWQIKFSICWQKEN